MQYTPLKLVLLLAPLVFSFAIGQDIFIPEVPQLTQIFHTTPGLVQLTLSLFMLAVGIGQLIIGPLCDRFGRKSIVLLSIALYTFASLGTALANDIIWLILMRIVQGIGACGMMVCAFAIGALSSFFTFFSVSPYILIKLLHVSEIHFGYYFALIGTTFFIGSITAAKLNVHWGIPKVALLGSTLFLLSGLSMLVWTLFIGTTLWSFLLPTALAGISGAFIMGAGAGGAMEPFADKAGTAAALLGASEFLLATLVGTIALQKPITSNMPLAIVLTFFGSLALIAILTYKRSCNYTAHT